MLLDRKITLVKSVQCYVNLSIGTQKKKKKKKKEEKKERKETAIFEDIEKNYIPGNPWKLLAIIKSCSDAYAHQCCKVLNLCLFTTIFSLV